ncbi:MAG TPA: Fic family protein [Patescibacteria group bacterium]|jgi:Fic family protein|nr:Fic family protein [Patescibacteria group bacterium]
MNKIASKPFTHTFLSQFILIQKLLPFSDDEIKNIDAELAEYEQVFLNPDIEKNLISRNELLASFAISKAENSTLTLQEAQDVYSLLLINEEYTFISDKLRKKEKLTQKDYDKLEFYNIAKTFRSLNEAPFSIDNITADDIRRLHQSLSLGLDVFEKYLPDFTVYKSGEFRDNDLIRVGSYIPAPYIEIEKGVEELLLYLKNNQTITGTAIFHTALYALHPFNNGNKRVCRILEHIFFRDLGLNQKNLYSTSYYYHKQKQRYYKYLLYSLERRNLNHFVSFVQEALVLSMIGVLKLSLSAKRSEFLSNQTSDEQIRLVLKPLIKRRELQFKNLFSVAKSKMSRQTFVNQLQKATDENIILKRETGRTTYYSLNFNAPDEEALNRWLTFAKKKLSYIPDEIKLI